MGADLYIEPHYGKAEKEFQPLFNEAVQQRNRLAAHENPDAGFYQGMVTYYMNANPYCFRSNYGAFANTLVPFGLSWWQDFGKAYDEGTNSKAWKLFMRKLKEAPIRFDWIWENDSDTQFWNGQSNAEKNEWIDFWNRRRDELVVFLEQARFGKLVASI